MSIEESLAKLHDEVADINKKFTAMRDEVERMRQTGIGMGHSTESDINRKHASELSVALLVYIRDTKQFLLAKDVADMAKIIHERN